MKKYQIALIVLAVAIAAAFLTTNIVSQQGDYADMYFDSDYHPYILVNDSTKYYCMLYSGCKYTFNRKLRNGKNILFSKFRESYDISDSDTEKNFIFSTLSEPFFQTYGLYIKESYMDELFKLSNISGAQITKDGDQVLEFGPSDKKAFKYFLETYSTELEDLFYQVDDHDDEDDDDDKDNEDEDIDVPGEEDSKDTDDSSVYEGDYLVDAFYNNGEVVRYIVSIDEAALSKFKELMK